LFNLVTASFYVNTGLESNKWGWVREKIYTDVASKAVGIFPPQVAKKLETFPINLLNKIKWVKTKKPKPKQFKKDLDSIINQMLKL